jgi:hypothetical protein
MVGILALYPCVPGQGERFISRSCVWVPICVFHSVAAVLLGSVQRDVCLIQKTLGLQFAESARDRYSHAYRHTAFLRGSPHRRVAHHRANLFRTAQGGSQIASWKDQQKLLAAMLADVNVLLFWVPAKMLLAIASLGKLILGVFALLECLTKNGGDGCGHKNLASGFSGPV